MSWGDPKVALPFIAQARGLPIGGNERELGVVVVSREGQPPQRCWRVAGVCVWGRFRLIVADTCVRILVGNSEQTIKSSLEDH